MVKVKICGITNEEDALFCSELGADFLGFIVGIKTSEDSLTKESAKKIIKKLPLEVSPVLVTNLTNSMEIIELADFISAEVIQLHNDITVEEIGKIRKGLERIKLTKTINVNSILAIKKAREFEKYVDYILLDTKAGHKRGGTGKTHDWRISKEIVMGCSKEVFLAGGLTPDNVISAIIMVSPYGVDVNSGVKSKPRIKDKEKLRLFIERAKGV